MIHTHVQRNHTKIYGMCVCFDWLIYGFFDWKNNELVTSVGRYRQVTDKSVCLFNLYKIVDFALLSFVIYCFQLRPKLAWLSWRWIFKWLCHVINCGNIFCVTQISMKFNWNLIWFWWNCSFKRVVVVPSRWSF